MGSPLWLIRSLTKLRSAVADRRLDTRSVRRRSTLYNSIVSNNVMVRSGESDCRKTGFVIILLDGKWTEKLKTPHNYDSARNEVLHL